MKFGMRSPSEIYDVLTKWYIQTLLRLAVVSFLNSVIFEFQSIIPT
jgi:hypothetical protein